MLDRDLAALYGVTTKTFNQAVKRHRNRFPPDFMFQLNPMETRSWRAQRLGIDTGAKMGIRRMPYAFTEQGVAMLSSVLNNERAVLVNISIMRAFVRIRGVLAAHKELAQRLETVEKGLVRHSARMNFL